MTLYRQNPNTAGRVIEEQAFVVTPDDNRLHMLNRTGAELWALAEAGFTIEQAAGHLATRYAVDRATAERDVTSCCHDLVARGIFIADEVSRRG